MHLDPRAPRPDRHTPESLTAVSEHTETEESCRRNTKYEAQYTTYVTTLNMYQKLNSKLQARVRLSHLVSQEPTCI